MTDDKFIKLMRRISNARNLNVILPYAVQVADMIAEADRKKAEKYYEEGVRIIETLKNAYILYKQQSPIEQRKLLNYLLSNCTLEGRKVSYDYNLPFSYFVNFDSCRKKYPGCDSNA